MQRKNVKFVGAGAFYNLFLLQQRLKKNKKTKEEIMKYKEDLAAFEQIKTQLMGTQIKINGRVTKNQMFDRQEFMVNNVDINPDPDEEIKRLNEEKNIPVLVFTDCDPWSFRIFASVAYGAIKTAHISEYLATPSSQYLGVTPSDIQNYELPTDELTKEDINALKSELTDPRFKDSFWKGEIKLQLKMKKKSEQQALAKYGLDYDTDTYLPEKLNEMGMLKK